MSIIDMIEDNYQQDAVYWAFAGNDGRGGRLFSNPVEIKCRWEEKVQMIRDGGTGEMILSRAIVFVTDALLEESAIFLGTLADLDSAAYEDPQSQENVYIIKQTSATPRLGSSTEFLYKAYLSEWQTN